MEVDLIIRIAGIGILTGIVAQILKHTGKDDIATLATLAGVIVVLMLILNMVSDLFSSVRNIFGL